MTIAVRALALSGITPGEWDALAAMLDETERARAARFAFDADRQAYVAAHALLRAELSRRAGGRPQDWRFAAAPLGKPFLLDPPRDLRFSLSHTGGMVAVAITEGVEIGVDVESAARRAESMALARRFFAPEDVALLEAADAAERRDLFFTVWTLKEAVVKAMGQGLSGALDSFYVTLDPPRVVMRNGSGPWRAAHWRLKHFHVALAAASPALAVDFQETDIDAVLT